MAMMRNPTGLKYHRTAARSLDLLQADADEKALQQRQPNCTVARVLGDFSSAQLTLLGQAFEGWNYDGQELQDDGSADVGHNAQRKD